MTSALPPNATALERALETAVCSPPVDLPIRTLWNPDTCPANLLHILAWSLSIDNWEPTWPESVKRERIRQAIPLARLKGTRAAVEDAIAALGGRVQIREWFERTPPAPRGTFNMVIDLNASDGAAPTQAFVDSVVAEVNRAKPASRHYTFTQILSARGTLGLKVGALGLIRRRLSLTAPAA